MPSVRHWCKRKDFRKMFSENKPEAQRLATLHNIYFYKTLFEKIRKAIDSGKSSNWEKLKKKIQEIILAKISKFKYISDSKYLQF